jgi:hypothetical protein
MEPAIELRLIPTLRSTGRIIPRFRGRPASLAGTGAARRDEAVRRLNAAETALHFILGVAKKLLASSLLRVTSLLLMMPVT